MKSIFVFSALMPGFGIAGKDPGSARGMNFAVLRDEQFRSPLKIDRLFCAMV